MSPQPAPGTDLSRAVCILHYGRCGSTVLTRLLVQYGCLSLGEVLHPVSGTKYEPLDGLPRERGAANSSAAVLDAAAKIVATNEDRIGRVLFEIKSLDFIREAIQRHGGETAEVAIDFLCFVDPAFEEDRAWLVASSNEMKSFTRWVFGRFECFQNASRPPWNVRSSKS